MVAKSGMSHTSTTLRWTKSEMREPDSTHHSYETLTCKTQNAMLLRPESPWAKKVEKNNDTDLTGGLDPYGFLISLIMRIRYIFIAMGMLLTLLLAACSNPTPQEEVNAIVEPTPQKEANVTIEPTPQKEVTATIESDDKKSTPSENSSADTGLSSSGPVDMTIIEDENYQPFNRYLDVYALRIFALDDITDEFIKAVALTYESMLRPTETIDAKMRQSFIDEIADANVFQRLGCYGPEFYDFEIPQEPNARKYRKDNKVDYIWQPGGPEAEISDGIGEVIEHLLHTVTTIGFSNLDPGRWDTSNPNSLLNLAKEEAIEKGIYDVSSYMNIGDPRAYELITAQEYVYWLIAAEWDFFEFMDKHADGFPLGGNEEFTIGNSTSVAQNLPLGHKLFEESVAKIISAPDKDLVTELFSSQMPCT